MKLTLQKLEGENFIILPFFADPSTRLTDRQLDLARLALSVRR